MKHKRQQVVFIGRLIWGGGAEKLMYSLAHSLDKALFEPNVVYMLSQKNVPIDYDPSIPLYCLQSEAHKQANEISPQISNPSKIIRTRILSKLPSRFKLQVKNLIKKQIAYVQSWLFPSFVWQADQHILIDLGAISEAMSPPMTYTYELRKILKNLNGDAILVAMQEEPTVQAWLNSIYNPHKYISYLCAPESIHLPMIYPDPDRLLVEKWLFSNACRSAQTITVPNTWMREDMIINFGVNPAHMRVIPNPIDCKLVTKKSQEPLPDGLDLSDKTIFVQLARLDPQKNHRLTVDACKILKQKYSNFIVLLIGDGSEKQKIEELVSKKNLKSHIIFMGELSNPYPFLKIARASLLTSNFEASPLALIDALLLGAVPISTDCIAGPSDTLGNGRFGLLVPPNDPQLFAEAMLNIAKDDNLHHKLRRLGMKHAWNFDISSCVHVWEQMLLEVGKSN